MQQCCAVLCRVRCQIEQSRAGVQRLSPNFCFDCLQPQRGQDSCFSSLAHNSPVSANLSSHPENLLCPKHCVQEVQLELVLLVLALLRARAAAGAPEAAAKTAAAEAAPAAARAKELHSSDPRFRVCGSSSRPCCWEGWCTAMILLVLVKFLSGISCEMQGGSESPLDERASC